MDESKKQEEVQVEPAAGNDGSLSEADLEQVAGGISYSTLGTRTAPDPFIFKRK